METHFSDAEKLYTEFVLNGRERSVLERANEGEIRAIADHLDDTGLWDMMNVPVPPAGSSKTQMIDGIVKITLAALNGEWIFADEVERVHRKKVDHSRKFRLREAELQDLEEDVNTGRQTHETTQKAFDMRMTSWRRRELSKLVPNISQEQLDAGWIPIKDFVWKHAHQKISPKNIRTASLLLRTLFATETPFIIDDKAYHAKELFGYMLSGKNYSYFINPIAIPMALEILGLAPLLPKDEAHANWISASEMATEVLGLQNAPNIAYVNSIARKMLKNPDDRIDIGTPEMPEQVRVGDVMGVYRQAPHPPLNYFDPRLKYYMKQRLGVFETLPEDRKHFVTEETLAANARLGMNPARAAIWHIGQLLRYNTIFDPSHNHHIDPDRLASRVVEIAAFGKAAKLYIEPELAADRFYPEAMKQAAGIYYKGDELLPPPPEHWLALSDVYKRFSGASRNKPEDVAKEREALLAWVKELCEQENPNVGYFISPGKNARPTYYVNPEIVGPDRLLNGPELRRRAGTERVFVAPPEGWLTVRKIVSNKLGLKEAEDVAALYEMVERLHGQKTPGIEEYCTNPVFNTTSVFVNPELVGLGKLISRKGLFEFRDKIKAEGWTMPEKKKSAGRGE